MINKRNTIQKDVVASVVLNSCDHPSADTIYQRARNQLPSLSLGTVYRILKTLVKDGVIREITVPSAPCRYDKTTRIHAHFVCRRCAQVLDVDMNEAKLMSDVSLGSENNIDEAEIIFRGICAKCTKEEVCP